MISFAMLSELVRSLFGFLALLLCLINLSNAVLAAVRRRYHFTALAFLLFAPCYFMWQVIFDFHLSVSTKTSANITAYLCSLLVVYWAIAFAVLTVAAVLLLGFNIRYDKTYITPGTIKLYLDKIPCGICCWRENGRVMFSNICMNSLCVAITGNNLLNGNHFYDATKGGILSVYDKVWRFSCREISIDGECLYELIASDITSEYAKTKTLEKDKEELSRLNQELWEYYLSIDDSVARKEILQAKISIHDEMNRLMLSTIAADKKDVNTLNSIFSLWEQNALLLCMEAEKNTQEKRIQTLDSLADSLGIKLIWKNDLPDELDEKQKELLFFTAQEAIINAVKHAQADEMKASFDVSKGKIICRFENNGKLPSGDVHFEGGLANLDTLAKKLDASVFAEINEKFALILTINQV
jgi:hypothetical protein